MTEHKFTDEEIIKALECCGDEEMLRYCVICPYYKENKDNDFCQEDLHKDALNLINRQREEIEVIKETTAEIRYEAVKEFADRLKTYYSHLDRTAGGLVEYHIDQVVKETLEGG